MFNPYARYMIAAPIYANEMHPAMPQQQTAIMGAAGMEIVGAESDLDQLLAMSGAAAYGSPDFDDVYSGLEMTGAEAFGADAIGVDPRQVPPQFLPQLYARHMAMQRQRQQRGPQGQQIPPTARQVSVNQSLGTHVRRQSLGLSTPAAVAAGGGTGVAAAQPQIPFRPEKLVVPSDFGGTFDIIDVKVGKDSQFIAPGVVPARVFDEKAVDNILSFHAAAISQVISVSVVNNGGVAQIFKCYMTGTSVE